MTCPLALASSSASDVVKLRVAGHTLSIGKAVASMVAAASSFVEGAATAPSCYPDADSRDSFILALLNSGRRIIDEKVLE